MAVCLLWLAGSVLASYVAGWLRGWLAGVYGMAMWLGCAVGSLCGWLACYMINRVVADYTGGLGSYVIGWGCS